MSITIFYHCSGAVDKEGGGTYDKRTGYRNNDCWDWERVFFTWFPVLLPLTEVGTSPPFPTGDVCNPRDGSDARVTVTLHTGRNNCMCRMPEVAVFCQLCNLNRDIYW